MQIKGVLAMLENWIERRPVWGILASFTGFGTTMLAWLHAASVVLGFGGALFGLLAGIYTWKIKRLHWKRLNSPDLEDTYYK